MEYSIKSQLKFGIEATYTQVINGLLFRSINRAPNFGHYDGADSRLYFQDASKINPLFTNVFELTNTHKGYRYNITGNATFTKNNLFSSLAYTYGVSKDVSSTVRSSPAANFEWNQAIFGNDPELSYSNYDLRHKIILINAIKIPLGKRNLLSISGIYNGRSGSPFSFVYQGDINSDGSSRNDLVYVPKDRSEIALVDISANGSIITAEQQWQQLDQYITNNSYLNERRGSYAQRNGAKTPWNHQFDLKIELSKDLLSRNRITISADIFNVLNLVNRHWGELVFVPNVVNSSVSVLKFEGVQDNIPQYSFNIPVDQKPWLVDAFNSRWRMQLGVKYDF